MEDWELGCDSDCDTCDNIDCPDHLSQRWKYSLEEAEAEWCQFGSWGLYFPGNGWCEFICPLRDSCQQEAVRAGYPHSEEEHEFKDY